MIGVTPVGILTKVPSESRKFYREVLGIDRVQFVKQVQGEEFEGMLLRLESPHIEVFSVETRLLDRVLNKIIRRDFALQYHPKNSVEFLQKLLKSGLEFQKTEKGKIVFTDLNGIHWEVSLNIVPPTQPKEN